MSRPLKTITCGLEQARPGMTVTVADGLYNAENGESFPLVVDDGISLVGEDWETTRIWGSGPVTGSEEVAVLIAGCDCRFSRFEVRGDSSTREMRVADAANRARISDIRMPYAHELGMSVAGPSDATIDNCLLTHPLKCICGTGIEFEGGDQGTIVRNCKLYKYENALYFRGPSDAYFESCDLTGNYYGFYLCAAEDPNENPDPDLGGGARGSLGRNILLSRYGIANETANAIHARYNTWSQYPPVEGEDFLNLGGGEVIW